MGKRSFITVFFVVVTLCLCKPMYPFEATYTHPALSKEAVGLSRVDNYLKGQLGISEGISKQLQLYIDLWPVPDLVERGLDSDTQSVLAWIEIGSTLEDAQLRNPRKRHHFHDPTRDSGLDNLTDHPDWWGVPTLGPFDLTGESTLVWAIEGIAEKEPTTNYNTWEYSRQYFMKP